MADVLPSCIGMEGLLYLLYSGFVQANKSHIQLSLQEEYLGVADINQADFLCHSLFFLY